MARDRANIFTNIWTDTDWRNLPGEEQRIYLLLMTHAELSYAGVCDWRPGRLSKMSADATTVSVKETGQALQDKRFVLIDEETEEVLIRSYIRHDGVLKQPNLAVSFVNAYGAAASPEIRMLIIHELKRLVSEFPDWAAFKNDKVMALLKEPSKSHAELVDDTPLEGGVDPRLDPPVDPQLDPQDDRHTLLQPLLQPPPSIEGESEGNEKRKKRETSIPDEWQPTEAHYERAKEKNLNVSEEAELFRNHALSVDRKAVRWNNAFTNWLIKAKPKAESSFDPWQM